MARRSDSLYHVLVVLTALVAFALILYVVSHISPPIPDPVEIDIEGQATMGEKGAPLHFVVFEDFNCMHCKIFTETVFPQIKKNYIDTNRASYTFIPLAFLQGSEIAARAAICMQSLFPEKFFTFVDVLYQEMDSESFSWSKEGMGELANRVGVNPSQFIHCMESSQFHEKMEHNMDVAYSLMGKDVATPTLYLNGVPVTTSSFSKLVKEIKKVIEQLKEKGGL